MNKEVKIFAILLVLMFLIGCATKIVAITTEPHNPDCYDNGPLNDITGCSEAYLRAKYN